MKMPFGQREIMAARASALQCSQDKWIDLVSVTWERAALWNPQTFISLVKAFHRGRLKGCVSRHVSAEWMGRDLRSDSRTLTNLYALKNENIDKRPILPENVKKKNVYNYGDRMTAWTEQNG